MTAKLLFAKYPGTCQSCRRPFGVGTPIEWTKAGGAKHADPRDCGPAASAPPPPPPVMPVVDLRPILSFLQAARDAGLKHPKARFLAPCGGELRLSLAGRASRTPGALQVVVNDQWVGRVNVDGSLAGLLVQNQPLLDTLMTIATNPAEAAQAYGALMCRCSFCGLALTDAGSVEVGYGPTCAKKWGLRHQPKGTPVVQAVAS